MTNSLSQFNRRFPILNILYRQKRRPALDAIPPARRQPGRAMPLRLIDPRPESGRRTADRLTPVSGNRHRNHMGTGPNGRAEGAKSARAAARGRAAGAGGPRQRSRSGSRATTPPHLLHPPRPTLQRICIRVTSALAAWAGPGASPLDAVQGPRRVPLAAASPLHAIGNTAAAPS